MTRIARKAPLDLHGMLAVNKPAGMSSKDVSRFLEGLIGRVKMGHVGTLDPIAEGVLPILLGSATRVQDFLLDFPKTYLFDVNFGYETDTLDSEGQVVHVQPADHVTEPAIQRAIQEFIGQIEQEPPVYSAVKYQGKSLYKYARAGATSDLPMEQLRRRVTIYRCELRDFSDGIARIELDCSRGTYVRVLAKDLARALGTCGTVTRLMRLKSSGIELVQAYSLDQIRENIERISDLIIPLRSIDLGLANFRSLAPSYTQMLQRGQTLQVRPDIFSQCIGASDADGEVAKPRTLMLLSEDGVAFGIGQAVSHQNGNMVVSMKRGLI